MSLQRAESHGSAGARSVKQSHGRAAEVMAKSVKLQRTPWTRGVATVSRKIPK